MIEVQFTSLSALKLLLNYEWHLAHVSPSNLLMQQLVLAKIDHPIAVGLPQVVVLRVLSLT